MSCQQYLIKDYSVGSTAPPIDFEWQGEDITGYTIELEVCFENGQHKTLMPIIDNVGDPGNNIPAAFHFDIPTGFWSVAGRHTGKLSIDSGSGIRIIPGFIFDVGEGC